MPVTIAGDEAVEDIDYGGSGDAELGSSFALGHDCAQAHELEFQAQGCPAFGCCPGNIFLTATVSRTVNFTRTVVQGDADTASRNVAPCPTIAGGFSWFGIALNQSASPVAFGTTGSVFVRFYPEV